MNDSQNQIIIEGLILQIETLKISLAFTKAKLSSKTNCNNCSAMLAGGIECECSSQEEHEHGACRN